MDLGVKVRVQGWAMMRVWCLWGIQVEVAPWVVENTGLDPEIGLRVHGEVEVPAGCHDAGRVWTVRRQLRKRSLGKRGGQEGEVTKPGWPRGSIRRGWNQTMNVKFGSWEVIGKIQGLV